MKPTVVNTHRFKPMHGWANRILRIDLSDREVSVQETAPYLPDFLGARGIAARVCWEEYSEPVDPFDPANPLMIVPGALTGSRSPYSGRTNVCAFSPQAYPYHWFTRSSIGGRFGGELKRAGYDGIIVTGASETPVRIRIRDDEVSIVDADDLWGLDTFDTIEALESVEGKGVRSFVIGPSGERLSRIATIQTATSSAAGQGGFGAVMGSKKLKAISVIGTGRVSLANPERLAEITKAVGEEARSIRNPRRRMGRLNERLAAEGGGSARIYACTESCPSPCQFYYRDVPGRVYDRKWSGAWFCVGGITRGMSEDGPISRGNAFDWRLGLRGGFEINVLMNRYGLNQWDIIVGMVPWLEACQQAGLISETDGHVVDWQSGEYWAEFLRAMAYREGIGDALAEGGWAAAKRLHLGEDLVRRYYTAWGHAGHWDGHGSWSNYLVFPYWLVSALQWLTDTRDPIPSGHGYVQNIMYYGPFSQGRFLKEGQAITWDHMRGIGARVYGDSDSLDPYSGYKAKAYPAFFHTKRSVMKDCLSTDDFVFPMIYSPNSPDRFCRIGDIKGTSVEYHLFVAGTGTDWSEEEFELAAARVYTQERALTVRHWARDRKMDEMVLPSFEYPENWVNPLLGKPYALDRQEFGPVMAEYYELQGWDPATGWPTRERLAELGIGEAYEPMVTGATRARAKLPPPPAAEPVPEVLLEPIP